MINDHEMVLFYDKDCYSEFDLLNSNIAMVMLTWPQIVTSPQLHILML